MFVASRPFMMQRVRFLSIALLAMGVLHLAPARAGVLLGYFSSLHGGGIGLNDPGRVAFGLGFGDSLCSPTGVWLGCSTELFTTESGSLEFNATNTPNFASITARLTDNVDDVVTGGLVLFDLNGGVIAPFNDRRQETNPALFGHLLSSPNVVTQVESIYLLWSGLQFAPTESVQGWDFGDTRFAFALYGIPGPEFIEPAPLPEPSTLLLLVPGLAIALRAGRNRQEKRTTAR
jgi:hypothetical protein